MATIDFPNPSFVGQTYVFNTRTWKWNGIGWEKLESANQVFIGFATLPFVDVADTVFPTIPFNFVLLVHI